MLFVFWCKKLHRSYTIDPRLPFPHSVGGIFPGPATTQKIYQGIEWFSQLAATIYLFIIYLFSFI